MAKTHSSLTTSDLHHPKGFSVESTATMFVMSQSISTATASFHFLPNDTDTYTLGNTARAWKELYVSTGSIHFVEKDGTVARTLEVDSTGFGFGGGDVSGSTISGSKLHIVGDTFIGGDLTLGDADSDSISIGADITSNLTPNQDNNYDLGTSAKQWKDIYINGIGYIDQLGTDADPVAAYINAGEIDGTVIGGESAAAATVTTLNLTSIGGNWTNASNTVADLGTVTTIDINGGAIDGAAIGAASHTTIKGTTIDATTDFTIDGLVISADDITNDAGLEIQTAAGDIVLDPGGNNVLPGSDDADDLGAAGTQWKDLYIDGVAYIDTLNADALGANLDHGNFNSTNVDIDSGAIDGTTIGANSAAAGTFGAIVGTSLNVSEGNITNVGNIALDTISADDGSSLSFSNNWTNAGRTVADLGVVTTVDINGGSIDGTTIGAASAVAGTFAAIIGTTIVGTTIDATTDFTIGSTVITDDSIVMTPSTSDTITFSGATNGALTITTVDDAAAAANLLFTIDGTAEIASAGVITLDSGAAINIEPAAGSAILLDGTISIDAGVVTGATSVTSTAFLGTLDGVVGGNTAAAGTFTNLTVTTDVNIDDSSGDGAIDGVIIGASTAASATFTSMNTTGLTTIGDASGDTLTINAATINPTNIAAGTDNTVIVYNGSTLLTDEIDSRVWGTTLVDTDGSGANNELATWSDADSIIGEGNLTFDGSTLTVTGATSITGDVDLGNATSDTITATARFDSDIVPSSDSARDLGTSALQFAEAHIDTGYIDAITVTGTSTLTTVDINGGNIDGTVIGASSPASGSFSGIIVTGGMDVQGNLTTISSTNLDIGDRIVTLNASSAAGDGGFYINDADTTETGSLLWDVSADRWIGGLKDAEVNLVTISSTDTLTNKTLTTPTIGNFTNATHTHANAANGGQITLGTGTTGNYVSTAVAGAGIDVSAATGDVTISIGTGEVVNAMIGDDEINSEHYAAGSIDNEHIADDAINSEHYAADSIDAEHYAAGSVDATAIGNDEVNSQHYAAASIDNEHLADNAVDSAELAAGSVDDAHLSDGVATGLAGAGMTAGSGVLNVIGGTGITANADNITTTDGDIVHDNLSGFVANEHIDHSGVTLTAGTGLNGGGTIAASRTFTVDAAQTVITSLFATDIKIGEDDQTKIDFETADTINFYTNNVHEFQMTSGGTFHADADIVAYSSTVASDKKLKTNINDTKYGLSDVLKLRGVDFNWKEKFEGKRDVGFIAQEVQEIIPELVKEVDSIGKNVGDTHLTVDYAKVVPILVESIKELKKEIDDLKSN